MIPCIVRASVVTATDPQGQNRIKVTVPQATGTAGLWAYPLTDSNAAPPVAGSAVWVVFESGNPALPVYIPTYAYSPWTPLPPGWLAAGWNTYTAAYRLSPGGSVQYRGELSTPDALSSTTLNNAAAVLTLPAALQASTTCSIPLGLLVGGVSGTTWALLRVNGATGSIYGGPWSYTGVTYLSLAALNYNLAD